MGYDERITEIEKEIATFDYERLKRLEQLQQISEKLQRELSEISQAVLTRQGEIIGLKRLVAEEELKEREEQQE